LRGDHRVRSALVVAVVIAPCVPAGAASSVAGTARASRGDAIDTLAPLPVPVGYRSLPTKADIADGTGIGTIHDD
jgi:hypothetical protein